MDGWLAGWMGGMMQGKMVDHIVGYVLTLQLLTVRRWMELQKQFNHR